MRLLPRLAAYRGRRYLALGCLWAAGQLLLFATGLILQQVFNDATAGHPAYSTSLSLLAVLAPARIVLAAIYWGAMVYWPAWFDAVGGWIRANLLASILVAPGPPSERMPATTGEAVSRFRDDVEDLGRYPDIAVGVVGSLLFAVASVAVMFRIDALMTAAVALPLVGVLIATHVLSSLIRAYHRRMREQGAAVTGFIGEMFAGVLVLKTAGAVDRALGRFRERNARRATAAVRAQLATDLMSTLGGVSPGLTTGLILLLAASGMRERTFTVGDLALFTTYAANLSSLPWLLGRLMFQRREASVAVERLGRLMPDRNPEAVLAEGPVYLGGDPPPAPPAARTPELRLRTLEVRGLTAIHPSSDAGVRDLDLRLGRGELLVVTGPIGAGKTTLLRALVGLVPRQGGSIRWNGRSLTDPGEVLVPPQVAYVGQAPALTSAALEENIRLGWESPQASLRSALEAAQLSEDVGRMPAGLETVVGSRGSRLSGGQVQRAAIARALVREPDLLILDDVSSALDGPTEERLWEALAGTGVAILAASHRRATLRRADRIILLERGRAVASGKLDELVERSPSFRRLWDTP
ncbi:MAG TPA: ABC transporter ATP-binding protein [Candidatus Dormibacteraeota bacterium]|jgi:ATP-binding cassette subfamily B protein|nr:ABC transporter ATP-binding protein [Candidatus Dormibacteraeota bacterium]